MTNDQVDGCLVRATVTRWVADEPFPGMVEVQFAEHDGTVVTIHEKCAVVGAHLDRRGPYPVEVLLDAEVLAVSTTAWVVRLLHSVEDLTGRSEFTVSWELTKQASRE